MASAKKCIAEKCKECIYDPTEPYSWRKQVENCPITTCGLYPVRPITVASINNKRQQRNNIIPTVEIE